MEQNIPYVGGKRKAYMVDVIIVTILLPIFPFQVGRTRQHERLILSITHHDPNRSILEEEAIMLPRTWSSINPVQPVKHDAFMEGGDLMDGELDFTVSLSELVPLK